METARNNEEVKDNCKQRLSLGSGGFGGDHHQRAIPIKSSIVLNQLINSLLFSDYKDEDHQWEQKQ